MRILPERGADAVEHQRAGGILFAILVRQILLAVLFSIRMSCAGLVHCPQAGILELSV